ncbi:MAG: right-handed parallel beta-helix repeat-containing protein, partial [Phycisphaerales bacterium]
MCRIAGKPWGFMAGRVSVRGAMVAMLCSLAVCLIASPARAQFGELVAFESPGNTTYYLDPDNGDDENRGTRPESAWRTLARVNTSRFAPGDKILLKAGATFHGKLWPKGTGIPGRPITIDSYGDGPPPAIHGDGEASATLLLENTNAWHIRNLELTNTGQQPEAFRYGISILIEDTGDAGDFVLRNLHVHGVNGTEEPGLGEGAAISFSNRGTNVPTRFDGVLIENCTVGESGRNGILIDGGSTDRARWLANLNVVIRENTIQNIRGDGIKLTGCDYAMVEYNTVAGGGEAADETGSDPKTGVTAGTRKTADAAGIALQHCDNTLVQFNEVGGIKGADSAAIRCGENSRANTFQFNFTHDNDGPMVRIIGDAPTVPAPGNQNPGGISAGNTQTTVRYNISQCDGGAFHLLGPINEARLYNNTVYAGPETRTVAVRLADRGG